MADRIPIKVLSVENNPEHRRILRVFMMKFKDDIEFVDSPDAAEALTKLGDKRFDVVIMDLSSKNIDSIILTKQIRELHPHVKIICCTASDDAADIFHAMDAGADGYVLKSNVAHILENAIRGVRLGTVWLDPGLAEQVLRVIEIAPSEKQSRVLPTGVMTLPLMPNEKQTLLDCKDGMCMVDPTFVRKIRRFAPQPVE
jgi:DNA-binding NarL/FixJ family response regulator